MLTAEEYQAEFQLAIGLADAERPRSIQTDGGILGASDAGSCPQKAVYTVTETPPSDVPKKGRARIGTALHEVFLRDVQATFPERIVEASLTVTLPSGVTVPLHPDEIDPTEPSVTDYKFTADIATFRRRGATEEQRMQRAMQYLAAHQAGIIDSLDGTVRNLYVSMTDSDEVHVDQEPFSMEWVEKADDWYGSVIYAVKHGEEALKTWPEPMCRDYCPFYSRCRPPIFDSDMPITNARLADLVDFAREMREERKAFETLEEEAVRQIKGVTGRTAKTRVVSTTVNRGGSSHVKVNLDPI